MRNILVLLLIALSSCATIDETQRASVLSSKDDLNALNGTYVNRVHDFCKDDYSGSLSIYEFDYYLWELFDSHKNKTPYSVVKYSSVEIEFLTSKKAEVRLVYEGNVIDKRKIKGKFIDGYFYKRKSLIVIPTFPILFGYKGRSYRIGLDENNQLLVDEAVNTYMAFLIAGVSGKAQVEASYAKR